MESRIYICQKCKHKKLQQLNIKLTVGSLPCAIGDCDICKEKPRELYSYFEYSIEVSQ